MKTLLRWCLFCALLLAFILVPFVVLEDRSNAFVEATLRPGQSVSVAGQAWTVASVSAAISPRSSTSAVCGLVLVAA